jgi:hypothetical protein
VGLPLLFAPIARVLRPAAAWLSETAPESLMRRARLTPTVLYRQVISLVMIAVACWMAGVLLQTCLELGASSRAAFGTTLIAVLSPPLLAHSTLFFTELPSAAGALFVFRRTHTALAVSPRGWLLIGAAIGLLVLLHVRTGINHTFWGSWVTTPHAALGRPAGIAATARKPGSGSRGSRSTRSSACCRTLQS